MSFNSLSIYDQLPLSSSFLHQRTLPIRDHRRVWKRRRLKSIQCQFTMYDNLISQIPSLNVNTLNIIAPALGLASGIALYLSIFDPKKSNNKDSGEWILFTSPTPFNRFVILRCPSITFEGSESSEDVNDRLVKEDRHFVRLNSGRIEVREGENERRNDDNDLMYQRVCITSDEDGGVISLDWPENMDLEGERGFDTTMVIIPGTANGSTERSIRELVCQCLRRGIFPVVMNPRGCAGSPLTTARLFTAGDSDDVLTAIEFIKRARPWTTLMGIGWGYGANMLTKYLAQVGEKTPLTAATCINNPFDLVESTRSSPHNLTLGLVNILKSNKELFQGRTKGFDVEKALESSSVRDFERAISMVSYGFDSLEDFYAKSSSRDMIGDLKIPVLFIQSDCGSVPLYSVPRGLIAENLFTSLLLCSNFPSNKISKARSSWVQNLAIEWLTAVELGLLKGRHPILKDVDVTVNPIKGLAVIDSKAFRGKSLETLNGKKRNFLKPDAYSVDALQKTGSDLKRVSQKTVQESNGALKQSNVQESSGALKQSNVQEKNDKLPQSNVAENNGAVPQSDVVNEEVVVEAEAGDRGQVLQTAQVVMNMLDVTIPNTLDNEQKQKVLAAVGQGESLMQALQGAVPEDVRGQLTDAVSGILQTQSSNLKFSGLPRLGKITDVLKPKLDQKVKPSNENVKPDDVADATINPPSTEKPSEGQESEVKVSEKLDKPSNTDQSEVKKSDESNTDQSEIKKGDESNTDKSEVKKDDESKTDQSEVKKDDESKTDQSEVKKGDESNTEKPLEGKKLESQASEDSNKPNTDQTELKKSDGSDDHASEKGKDVLGNNNEANDYDQKESGPETGVKPESSNKSEGDDSSLDSQKVDNKGTKEENTNQQKEEKSVDSSSDETNTKLPVQSEDTSSPPQTSSETTDQKKDDNNNNTQPSQNQNPPNPPNPPNFNVSQALAAFTGIDDSTQMAVNSVFGVIENMITQLEEKEKTEPKENVEEHKHNKMDKSKTTPSHLAHDSDNDSDNDSDKRLTQEVVKSDKKGSDISKEIVTKKHMGQEFGTRGGIIFGEKSPNKLVESLHSTSQNSLCISPDVHKKALYKENLHDYPSSKVHNTKSLDLDSTTALFLDYFPEEGQWKCLESENDSIDIATDIPSEEINGIVVPSYVILDGDIQQDDEDYEVDNSDENVSKGSYLRSAIVDALKIEVERRLSNSEMKKIESDLSRDMEHVANAIYVALAEEDTENEEEHVANAISSAVLETEYLKKVLSVGLIVGSSLAALRKNSSVSHVEKDVHVNQVHTENHKVQEKEYKEEEEEEEDDDVNNSNRNAAMFGAVTAAVGASAIMVNQQDNVQLYKEQSDSEDEMSEQKSQGNIVSSLAEKAMSVAGPVVPTTQDGEVDQDRLVAMLAELGQRGGLLRLVGKLALLWGGIRGAMSLTDKLISFLRFTERPLYQRILGFMSMVLVLWSPIVIPLLPSLVQGWTTQSNSTFAELGCIVGLYASVLLLIASWGRRVHGYENPLDQYGLRLNSVAQVNFLKGLIAGVIPVIVIHSIHCILGCANLHMPVSPSSNITSYVGLLKLYGKTILLIIKGLATAIGVSVVEELLFRSWLPNEISVDLGFHRGIIISGLIFSLAQRSAWGIPGLWLLSLALSGARERSKGNLLFPVGLRAGILASSYILQTGGFLIYQRNFPIWFTGTDPFQPFSGVIGITFALVLALILYPRYTSNSKKLTLIT